MEGTIELGKAIAGRRRQRGLAQSDLARAIRVDQSSISNIEHGRRGVSILEVAGIADCLGVTVEELLPQTEVVFSMRGDQADSESLEVAFARCSDIIENFLMLEAAVK